MMGRAINQGDDIMAARASLEIYPNPEKNKEYYVRVRLEGFINPPANATVAVRVRGSDEWFDDRLFTYPSWPHNRLDGYIDQGASYSITSGSVPGSSLNEDWGDDEIYALVKVTGFGEVRTNTVTGNY
jgi:hypothetical protein